MTTVKLRKNSDNLNHLEIVSDYAEGILSLPEIAEKHKTTEENVGLITKRFWKSLTNMRESRVLLGGVDSPKASYDMKNALVELNGTHLINEEFTSKLSDPQAHLLTDEEALYAWTYVHTGDLKEALEVSKLNVGLYKEKGKESRFSYDRALALRGAYMNSKPNVVAYIKELRESRLIDADVGKARVQSELIEQIEQMKASGSNKNRMAMLRAIELLGKTVGAFVDRLEVREINPSDALDELIELAKNVTPDSPETYSSKEISQ